MRLLKQTINPTTHKGSVKLRIDEPEDAWHLYNLIRPGDVVKSSARRKVVKETASAALDSSRAATSSKVIHTTLSVMVVKLDYDPHAAQLHVSGRVCDPNDHVDMWAFHTLDLVLDTQLELTKGRQLAAPGLDRHTRSGRNRLDNADDDPANAAAPVDAGSWDSIAMEVLAQATDVNRKAVYNAVVMDEGLANICALTEHQTVVRQRIRLDIPRKRQGHGAGAHDKALSRFYDQVVAGLEQHTDILGTASAVTSTTTTDQKPAAPPPLVLASPGFTAQALLRHMQDRAVQTGNKTLAAYLRDRVVIAHSSTGHLHSLHEALASPAVASRLADTRFARETTLMSRFLELLRDDAGWAWYGPGEVERAVASGAVGRGGGVLLISDRLFRSADVRARRRWVALVDRVRGVEGGEVRVLSSAHESGRRLEGLGDIGAILTFPLLDLDEDEDEEAPPRDGFAEDEDEIEPNRNHERDEEIEI